MTTQKEPVLLYPGEYVLLSRDWVMWRANQLYVENPKKHELWVIHTAVREGVDLITKDYTKEEKEKFITPNRIALTVNKPFNPTEHIPLAETFQTQPLGGDARLVNPPAIRMVRVPAEKAFAVYRENDVEITTRYFLTNTGSRAYMRHLASILFNEVPNDLKFWGYPTLEELHVNRDRVV